MGDNPIRHNRVKRAKAVKVMGAIRNSHSSSVWMRLGDGCGHSLLESCWRGHQSDAYLPQLLLIFSFDLVDVLTIGLFITGNVPLVDLSLIASTASRVATIRGSHDGGL
jgi:hypothetical protein